MAISLDGSFHYVADTWPDCVTVVENFITWPAVVMKKIKVRNLVLIEIVLAFIENTAAGYHEMKLAKVFTHNVV